MNKNIKQYIFKSFCCMALCGLLLNGCGQQTQAPRGALSPMAGGTSETTDMTKASAVMTAEEEMEALPGLSDAENVDEILELLVEDDGVRERIRYGIGLSEADTLEIVRQKLEKCTEIVLEEAPYGNPIYSLEDLRLLPNLKQLVIDISEWDDTVITDFSPVAQLSQLEQVYISYGKEEPIDLSFLGEADTITELFITNSNLKDISFLEEMPQLRRLSLYETPVEDLAVLEKLPELVELSLSGNENAKHIEAVGTLTKMEDLGLQYCGIEDISFLSGLTELRGVNLNGNSITDLTPLAGLHKLERLGLSQNGISDISALENLTNLFDLAMDGNEIQDISVLAKLPRLNQVGISDNRIEDLSPLAGKKELMYAAVFGNPVKSLEPVWDVPQLLCMDVGVSKEEEEIIAGWLEEHYPEAEEVEYIDFIQGDLNNDGRQDIAFVVDSDVFDVYEEDFDERIPYDRRLFILLQQKDSSWREPENVPWVLDSTSGGMRGDPYHGIFMEAGYLLIKTGWGSSGGVEEMERYVYRNGALSLVQTISVGDYAYADGYDVRVRNEQNDTWQAYAIAMDGYRMVRVDLADSEHPYHKAFPEIDLYDMSYYVHPDKQETRMTSSEALDSFCAVMTDGAVREKLPYAAWQKENHELLKGVVLPDYYYVLPGTAKEAEVTENSKREAWEGDYIYYGGITYDNGELYHIIDYVYYVQKEHRTYRNTTYLLKDATGEISER